MKELDKTIFPYTIKSIKCVHDKFQRTVRYPSIVCLFIYCVLCVSNDADDDDDDDVNDDDDNEGGLAAYRLHIRKLSI